VIDSEVSGGKICGVGGQNDIVIRRITTFRSTTDRIYDGGPIRL